MKARIVIATWFYEGQPGFLDFKYRIEALARRYQVTLLLRHECFRSEFADLPLTIQVLHTKGTSVREQFGFLRRCARTVKNDSADLLVLLGSQLALCAYMVKSVPTLLYWNEHPTHFFYPDYRNPLKRLVYRSLLRGNYAAGKRVTRVMPIGEAHREDLIANGVPAARAELIYMGVEDRFGYLAKVNSGPALRLVYTGTVIKERGRDVMLEGVALARRQGLDVRLTIVGAGEDQLVYCRDYASTLGIADAVDIVGRVPGSAIPAYLAEADVGICIWEDRVWWRFNPPTKLFEYLVAGLPVMASRIRTHTDYIHDGANGWIFDYDAAAFAECLQRIQDQRAELPAVSLRAHGSGQRYLWSHIEPQFLAVVDDALNPGQSSRVPA
ncbi:hypothetical protein JHS3_04120 [Jeongeupia sp. HS-3]|uniref:glycosyltransferase family 4 protein n=1 Tax=Jeongeupia sp. HS-3 TaxID=1009682 RepID=UPI0018A423FD|nr:glycosyltransferase family 4 protein [Jeongeupia sp. HS-3]BCL74676.1 hypothetical protein JHS3_04120 [Jeongeupia sp. HS-3]